MPSGFLQERAAYGLHDYLESHLAKSGQLAGRVCDIGCGTGAWARRLISLGASEVIGIERDLPANPPRGLSVKYRDLNEPGWWNGLGQFPLITSIEVIEHIPNTFSFLSGLREILTSDGFALLTTPNVHAIRIRLKYLLTGRLKQFDFQGDQTHVVPIFLTPFERLCGWAGLRIERFWTYPERGAVTVGPRGKVAHALGIALNDELPGDNLCLIIRRA